jgi:hypothetical protein
VGQSFLLFLVILSILSHSFFSQSFFLFSVILSFLSNSFYSQSFPQPDPTCRPFSLPFLLRRNDPDNPGEPLLLGPHAEASIPTLNWPRSPHLPCALTLAATGDPSTAALSSSAPVTSVSPWSGRSAVLQTATSPAKVSPRHPEAPRAQCRSPTPRYRREFAKKPPPVSRSAVPIRRRRCRSGPADSLCTSAGPSRSVSAIQRTRPPLQHLPPRAPPALPPDVVVFLNPSRLRPPQPSVSLASYPWSFCTRSCRH